VDWDWEKVQKQQEYCCTWWAWTKPIGLSSFYDPTLKGTKCSWSLLQWSFHGHNGPSKCIGALRRSSQHFFLPNIVDRLWPLHSWSYEQGSNFLAHSQGMTLQLYMSTSANIKSQVIVRAKNQWITNIKPVIEEFVLDQTNLYTLASFYSL
jgi:hypothetical protein